jgi:hypothetical protein
MKRYVRKDRFSNEPIDVPALAVEVLKHLLALVTKPASYSSRRGCGPEGYSDCEWKALAKKIGVQRGRWYYVAPERLDAYEKRDIPAPASMAQTPLWTPEIALRKAGLRPTRVASS